MMRVVAAALLLAAGAGAGGGRETIGIHGRWGAFREREPLHCFAIAEPVSRARARGVRPFASISTWPGAGVRNQLHVRLSRPRAGRAAVTLSIGERRFALAAGPLDAWAPDARTDRAIVSAMRSGRSMSVETVSAAGRPFADIYALPGAATAIDAAALACIS